MPIIRDNGGRRSGLERRGFTYSGYIVERRSLKDRRSGEDRRTMTDRRLDNYGDKFIELRSHKERRKAFII